jgi:hypothetical protein
LAVAEFVADLFRLRHGISAFGALKISGRLTVLAPLIAARSDTIGFVALHNQRVAESRRGRQQQHHAE